MSNPSVYCLACVQDASDEANHIAYLFSQPIRASIAKKWMALGQNRFSGRSESIALNRKDAKPPRREEYKKKRAIENSINSMAFPFLPVLLGDFAALRLCA